jgi:PiT family inorganic phosphate transporter
MAGTWLLTLPSAAVMGALAAWVATGGTTGTVLVGAALLVASAGIYALSRRKPVTADNVNELPVPHPPQLGRPAEPARAAA